MRVPCAATLLALFMLSVVALASSDSATPAPVATTIEKFSVFHNLQFGEYVQRGELQIMDDGTAQYQSIGVQDPPHLTDTEIMPQDPTKYAVVLQSSKGKAQYVLPIDRCRLSDDDKTEETFVLHTAGLGSVFHVDYDAGKTANCLQKNRESPVRPVLFTRVLLRPRAIGPTPKLAAVASIDATTGKEKQPEPQRSFLAKYWYYIIPLVLVLLFTGEEPQQEGNARR
ncbi:hypothetical protein COEREDRAFT_93227 [Coemansia reversa NRRL 1564]|uniref:ER membrane protein complex subunit 10 n=1 Tax=Coemansia reversa (strain ATCC 12441 / NRRL 1564) TaxID=763665 RepID=A0A2G5B9L1_COERN|nr:hypothetical protein COEREDRAFT_93227 [Coemansia reversa NRRL 1564]|eukprot:PIA15417.1 hypothetical protein COEREDRAFT_93227 [Coemansia reversa NRRL 1564]